jgi:ketosteroid isomerase-like protein
MKTGPDPRLLTSAGSVVTSESASPREVFERLIDGISHRRWQALHELYAQDALVEYPFALPVPTRLDGREAIRRYFAAVARMPLELRARNITVHQTGDPEVIVGEWDYDGLRRRARTAAGVADGMRRSPSAGQSGSTAVH